MITRKKSVASAIIPIAFLVFCGKRGLGIRKTRLQRDKVYLSKSKAQVVSAD